MLPVKNVELTKVHYFEPNKHHRNFEVKTISHEVSQNMFNKNLIIKKNIFGHKWVLSVNELSDSSFRKKKSVKCLLYCVVFSCILFAVLSGLFFTFELDKVLFNCPKFEGNQSLTKIARSTDEISKKELLLDKTEYFKFTDLNLKVDNQSLLDNGTHLDNSSSAENNLNITFCLNCTSNQVCLKLEETKKPECVNITDTTDLTGCGGHCLINDEYCHRLLKDFNVYQCRPSPNKLICPKDTFSCSDRCIAPRKVCDGVYDCKEKEDEKNCDCRLVDHFQCDNKTRCIPLHKRCDKVVDCLDVSDEYHCHKKCPIGQFGCTNGVCIAEDLFCNGAINCLDKSDEPQGC